MTTTAQAPRAARRAADSSAVRHLARGGFICYGIVHLLLAWVALRVAFGHPAREGDQRGALQTLAAQPLGKALVIVVVVGMVALALWQGLVAAIGESGERGRTAVAERVVNGCRAVIYLWLAWTGVLVVRGAGRSPADSQEQATSQLLSATGGRWLVGLVGVVVVGVGLGLLGYGATKRFERRLDTGRMSATMHRTIRRLGVGGYAAKGVAYAAVGVLVIAAAVTYDADKARGLDGALRTLAGQSWGPWLLGLIALGFAAYGIYCFAQARYRKV
ncbi:uncharacterized protein DUF1206 [Krasilnikovia cinnamomea]|uniref:Uncharacterized protein DUF1206 n=1 Tax=Krasilnikovia cinnamomea TaxID=349313 RepID=A0A4Q7ZEK2_9ACTN|nr:DUF1206 domain-containing protein [Krasilnikovia cinnamomea]RZU48681.1 uncharacterized protein DUF1206 [Krasilnikovia cinnamomea]